VVVYRTVVYISIDYIEIVALYNVVVYAGCGV